MYWLLRACVEQSACAIKNIDKQNFVSCFGAIGRRASSALATSSNAGAGQESSIESILASASDAQEPNAASLVHLYSAANDDDVVTVAAQCGARLTGQELRRLQESFTAASYPAVSMKHLLYPPGAVEDIQMQVIRRHNLSMPCKHNQRIYGTVYAHNQERAWVDVGHSALAIFKRSVCTSCFLPATYVLCVLGAYMSLLACRSC